MSNQPLPVRRSWTSEEEGGVSRWLVISLLLFLLAVGIFVFVWNIGWGGKPKVFVATFAVEEYDTQLLPEPAYPVWPVQAGLDALRTKGIQPWTALNKHRMTTEVEVRGEWAGLAEELKSHAANPRDTLLVYIRGNAVATAGDVFLLGSDFSNTDLEAMARVQEDAAQQEGGGEDGNSENGGPALPNAVRLSDVFRNLQTLPVRNVLVLADICDLPSIPKLGVLANDTSGMLNKTVAALDGKTPLWVISAAGSYQNSHVSFKRRRTLLQAASEYACNVTAASKSQDFLSLANFYESVLRYSHQVTEATQTPILLRSGQGAIGLNKPREGSLWAAAQQVCVGGLVEVESSEPADEEAEALLASSQTLAEDPDQDAPGQQSPADEVLTPSLNYWRLHDALLSRRGSSSGWSPLDFAIQRWRKRERDAAFYDRQARLGETPQAADYASLVSELEQIETLLQTGDSSGVGSSSRFDLASGWAELSSTIASDRSRLAWQNPDVLEPSVKARWLPIRQGYRTYFDAMGRLAGWLELVLAQPEQERSEMLGLVRRLTVTLVEIGRSLPDEASDSMLNHPLPKQQLDRLDAIIQDIDASIADRVSVLRRAIASAKRPEREKLSWRDERLIQQLLDSPNLPFSERKLLETDYASLLGNQIADPGVVGKDVDTSIEMDELLAASVGPGRLGFFRDWSEVLGTVLAIVDPDSPQVRGASAEDLNELGRELSQRHRRSDSSDPIRWWKQACVADLVGVAMTDERFNLGLIAAVSDDLGLNLKAASRVVLSSGLTELPLGVSHRNGEIVQRLWVECEVLSPAVGQAGPLPKLRVGVRGGPPELDVQGPHQVRLADGRLRLDLQMTPSADPAANNSQVRRRLKVRLAMDKASLLSDSADVATAVIELIPPRPNQVGLVARRVDAAGRSLATYTSKPTPDGWILKELSVPAIGKGMAKSQYEFFAVNGSATDKLVQLKLYAVPPPSTANTAGNGRINSDLMALTETQLTRLQPSFVSATPVKLLAVDDDAANLPGGGSGQRVELIPVPGGEAAAAAGLAIGEFGLLCLIEELTEPTAERGAQPTGNTWFHWIDCVPQNPVDNLVKIQAQDATGLFRFNLSVAPEEWGRFQIKQLRVNAFLTDALGHPVPVLDTTSATLTLEEPQQSIVLRPDMSGDQRERGAATDMFFAHISIGEYPRATAFQSRLRGATPGNAGATLALRPFLWLEPTEMSLVPRQATPEIPVLQKWPGRNAYIVPCQIGASESSTGVPADYAALMATARVDFPRGGDAEVEFLLGGVGGSLSVDRKFQPQLECLGGKLVFSAAVTDHVYAFTHVNSLKGLQPLKVVVKSGFNDVAQSVDLVFDRVPPKATPVKVDAGTLYPEEFRQLSLEQVSQNLDTDTPLDPKRIFFAIDQGVGGNRVFDASDEFLDLKVQSSSSGLTAMLKAEAFKDFVSDEYRIVARTVDMAGNVQDKNASVGIFWNPIRPKVEPPPIKSDPKPPPPAAARKHTVRVQVTLGGKPLTAAQFRKTEVTGISAHVVAHEGGTWIYTFVPEASYEVKASLVENGLKYEGNASITVNSGKNVSIQLKPAL